LKEKEGGEKNADRKEKHGARPQQLYSTQRTGKMAR
jgi:hypothetical protein